MEPGYWSVPSWGLGIRASGNVREPSEGSYRNYVEKQCFVIHNGNGTRAWGLGFRAKCLGIKVQGSWFRIQGLG